VDARIRELPGLAGVDLLAAWVDRFIAPASLRATGQPPLGAAA
jgi:hypothetical protein